MLETVTYRVLQNPITAPDGDYIAQAIIMEDHGDGYLTVVVTPKRSDPFLIGPITRVDLRDENSSDYRVWEPVVSPLIFEGV